MQHISSVHIPSNVGRAMGSCERERMLLKSGCYERQREKGGREERDTETETETERQRRKQRERDRERKRQMPRETERNAHREKDIETETDRQRPAEREGRERHTQTDRQTGRQIEKVDPINSHSHNEWSVSIPIQVIELGSVLHENLRDLQVTLVGSNMQGPSSLL